MTRIMPVSSVRNNHVMVMRSSEADNMTGEAAYSKKKDNIAYKKVARAFHITKERTTVQ